MATTQNNANTNKKPGSGPERDADKERAPATPGKKPGHTGETTGPSTGRTIEAPGQPGLEKEPNRDKAIGPGGQRMVSTDKPASREATVEGVDTPDGINQIDPMGETTAEDTKLL